MLAQYSQKSRFSEMHLQCSKLVIEGIIHWLTSIRMDEMFRAASDTAQSLLQQPHKFDSANSPFATRHKLSAYQYYERNPEKGARFARAMAGVTQCKLWYE